ncbi:MAG: autoinducer binding domain-containing protein [Exilibacterium sp.]
MSVMESTDSVTEAQRKKIIAQWVRPGKFYKETVRAGDIHEFHCKIMNIVKRLGFSDYSCIPLYNPTALNEFLLSSYPKKLRQDYTAGGFHKYDIVLSWAQRSAREKNAPTPVYQSAITYWMLSAPIKTDYILMNQELLSMVRRYGYRDCYNIAKKAYCNANNAILFSVAIRNADTLRLAEKIQAHEFTLELLAQTIDYVGSTLFPEYFTGAATPSADIDREGLLLLQKMGEVDCTLKRAMDLLNMKHRTGNYHMARLRETLGVETNCGALFEAIKRGLLTPRV